MKVDGHGTLLHHVIASPTGNAAEMVRALLEGKANPNFNSNPTFNPNLNPNIKPVLSPNPNPNPGTRRQPL